mgnify:CR=1 FL=1
MNAIDPLWVAEFCGLFWGEGNFMFDVMNRQIRKYPTFTIRVRCRIVSREDNVEMLDNIWSVLGGNLTTHKGHTYTSWNGKEYTNHRQIVWQVQSRDAVERILDLLDTGRIPCKKRLEVPIMREAIALMKARRYSYTDEQREQARDIQARLYALRHYTGC